MSTEPSHETRARNAQESAVELGNGGDFRHASLMAQLAQSSATLALVEQQRNANLIAIWASDGAGWVTELAADALFDLSVMQFREDRHLA